MRSYNPEHPALKVHNCLVRHQVKTIEKTLKLFCLRRSFTDPDEQSLFFEKICFLSPPGKIEDYKVRNNSRLKFRLALPNTRHTNKILQREF